MFTVKEWNALPDEVKNDMLEVPQFCECGNRIYQNRTYYPYFIEKRKLCFNCYYAALDEVLTNHPIGVSNHKTKENI